MHPLTLPTFDLYTMKIIAIKKKLKRWKNQCSFLILFHLLVPLKNILALCILFNFFFYVSHHWTNGTFTTYPFSFVHHFCTWIKLMHRRERKRVNRTFFFFFWNMAKTRMAENAKEYYAQCNYVEVKRIIWENWSGMKVENSKRQKEKKAKDRETWVNYCSITIQTCKLVNYICLVYSFYLLYKSKIFSLWIVVSKAFAFREMNFWYSIISMKLCFIVCLLF